MGLKQFWYVATLTWVREAQCPPARGEQQRHDHLPLQMKCQSADFKATGSAQLYLGIIDGLAKRRQKYHNMQTLDQTMVLYAHQVLTPFI